MIATSVFETEDYGPIEVSRATNANGSRAGTAYFKRDDYETHIGPEGVFHSMWGVRFVVHWPMTAIGCEPEAYLEVCRPVLIARSKVTGERTTCPV